MKLLKLTSFFSSKSKRVHEAERIEKLLSRLCMTDMGKNLVSFLKQHNVEVFLENCESDYGRYYSIQNRIGLNAREDDDVLFLFLAHEAIHAWQAYRSDLLKYEITLPPLMSLAGLRFKESQAFAFAQYICEEYIEKTGDQKLRQALVKTGAFIDDRLTTKNSFIAWCTVLKKISPYDGFSLEALKEMRECRSGKRTMSDEGFKKHLFDKILSPDHINEKIISMLRQSDVYPFMGDESTHYLADISDRKLLTLLQPRADFCSSFAELNRAYKQFYLQKIISDPEVKIASAQKLKVSPFLF